MVCECCGNEYTEIFGTGRFCSLRCLKTYSTLNIKGKTKEVKCVDCGKKLLVDIHCNPKTTRCLECRKSYTYVKYNENSYRKGNDVYHICKICGQPIKNDDKCTEFCCTHNIQQFKTLIKYFGFDKSTIGTKNVFKEFERVRTMLYDLYWDKNYSTTDIANMFNYKSEPTNIAQKFFKYLDIPVKNPSRAVTDNFLTGRISLPKNNNTYVCGWHTTWDNNSVYLRSSYEFDFAKELDNKKIHYEVEKIRIRYFDTAKNDYRCALPDFYIPETNTIYEIKSEYTYNKVEMDDKFKEYKNMGYNCVLVLEHKEIKI